MIQAAFSPEFDDQAADGSRPLQQCNLWAEFTLLFTNNFPDTSAYKSLYVSILLIFNIISLG